MIRPTETQSLQWAEKGCLVFENAIQGDELQRLQDAFDYWAEKCKPAWLDRVAAGEASATFYDIPNVLEKDEIFVDIVDHPSYYGNLMAFTDDDLIFLAPQVRLVPPWPLSYTGWHPDVPQSNPLHIKVQIYVNDVEPGCGEFSFVPGSHKPDAGPYSRVHRLESMPGHKTFPGKAGSAIMFNSYGWHTAMDNHTDTPRKSIILIYEKRTPERVDSKRFTSIAHYCTTPERRQLFGLES
ncbi:MAG: phytanoyl-CoA dioxygenase family protein [Candidatus Poribacteria bacterium]|nr:phytanoyl-CoA dioxygenase family protein [Candidatus Poribacteria bacterium]